MLFRFLAAGALALASTQGFAGDTGQSPDKVSLDSLKAKCADIMANPQQVKPRVKISCSELSYHWTAGTPQTSSLCNQRNIGAAVEMKSYQVGQEFFSEPIDDTPVQCAQFVKVERKVHPVDVDLSCDDLAAIDDLGKYCAPIVDQRAGEDASLVEERQTNDVITLCPNVAAQK